MSARAASGLSSPLIRGLLFRLSTASVILLGLAAQFRSYASPDTGFLLDEAARVLDGARVYVDLVEMNPPLTVILNVSAVMVARALGILEGDEIRSRLEHVFTLFVERTLFSRGRLRASLVTGGVPRPCKTRAASGDGAAGAPE